MSEPSSAKKTYLIVAVTAVVVILLVTRPWAEKKPAPGVVASASPVETSAPTSTTVRAPELTGAAPTVATAAPVTSGAPIDMSLALHEAKIVESARAALDAGDPRKALAALEEYDRIPNAGALKPEATMVKIEALSKVGRKTDALALAMLTRDDPAFANQHARVENLLVDAGLSQGRTSSTP